MNAELRRSTVDGVERPGHDPPQTLIYFVLGPGKGLQRLNPFEVGNCHPSSVRKDVRDDEHLAVVKNLVSLGGGWTIGGLGNQSRLNLVGIGGSDLFLERGGNEDFSW